MVGACTHGCFGVIYASSLRRIYTVLPLFHSAGGVCGIGMMINGGATVVLKRKFSLNSFWEDCRVHK